MLARDSGSDRLHPIATLVAGDFVGEMALLDDGKRTASARALDRVEVVVIPTADLTLPAEMSVNEALKLKLARIMVRRTQQSNEQTAQKLQEMIDEAERRVEMSKFMSRVMVGVSVYTFSIGAMLSFGGSYHEQPFAVVGILAAFSLATYLNIKTSPFSVSDYGFNVHHWVRSVASGLGLTLLTLGIALLAKSIGVMQIAAWSDHQLVEPDLMTSSLLTGLFSYGTFVLAQEFIVRSGLQSSLMIHLTMPNKTLVAIVLSGLLMSTSYALLSLWAAILVFPFSLALGWVYSRYPTLTGTALAHFIVGSTLLWIVGLPF